MSSISIHPGSLRRRLQLDHPLSFVHLRGIVGPSSRPQDHRLSENRRRIRRVDRSAGHHYFRNVVQRPGTGDGSPHGFRSFAGPAPPMGQTVEVDGEIGDDPLRLRVQSLVRWEFPSNSGIGGTFGL
jgi:hypothetical protein